MEPTEAEIKRRMTDIQELRRHFHDLTDPAYASAAAFEARSAALKALRAYRRVRANIREASERVASYDAQLRTLQLSLKALDKPRVEIKVKETKEERLLRLSRELVALQATIERERAQ